MDEHDGVKGYARTGTHARVPTGMGLTAWQDCKECGERLPSSWLRHAMYTLPYQQIGSANTYSYEQ